MATVVAGSGSLAGQGLVGQNFNGRTIRHISFESDGPIRRIDRSDLEKLVVLQEGQVFTDSKARSTVTQLLATDLFWDAHIQVEPIDEHTIDVQIVLIRLYEVSRLRFEGDVRLASRELLRELEFREGEPYSDDALELSLTRLKDTYRRHGFYRPQIKPNFELDDRGRPQVAISFSIEAGVQARVASLTLDVGQPAPSIPLRSLIQTGPGRPFSQVQLDSDLESIRRHLALGGYFHPEVYVRGGVQYDEQDNSVALDIRVVPREHTEIQWVGPQPKESELRELPLYAKSGPQRLLLEETVSALTERLQKEGYFRAAVSFEIVGLHFPPSHVTIQVEPGHKYDLSEIRFEGNQAASSEVLEKALASRKAGLLSRGTLTATTIQNDTDNLQSLFQQRGYLDVTVKHRFEASDGNLTLVYEIQEGPEYRVGTISLSGDAHLPRELLLQGTSLREGGVFSPYLLASDRSQIMAAYETRGYRSVQVEPAIEHLAGHVVDIQYTVTEGPQIFTKYVLVAGNELTRRKLIDKQILIEPGQPLSYERLLQSETNLYNLAVFNRVRVKELPVYDAKEERSALVSVEEAKKYSLIYGIGYSHSFGSTASEGLRGTVGITDTNFQGMARVLALSVRAGRRRQWGNLTYTLPRLLGKDTPTALSLSVDNEKRIENNDTTQVIIRGRPYDSFRAIASFQAERALSRRESMFLRYNFERVKLRLPQDPAIPPEFFRDDTNLRLSKVALSYLNDSRNEAQNPTEGFFLNGEASLAPRLLGSERQFVKVFTQGRYYFPLYTDLTLVTALRLGIIKPFGAPPPNDQSAVPISERFFAGGPSTLRGLPIDQAGPLLIGDDGNPVLVGPDGNKVPVPVGGNALIVGNVELRFPIFSILGGALFYDTGNVFKDIGSIPSSRFENDFGFGLAVRTPVGPVRIDFAYNPAPPEFKPAPPDFEGYKFKRWNIHISIGNPF